MDKEIKNIFYSWQSDLDSDSTINFIENVIGIVIKELKKEGELRVEPVLDRDISGETGSPDITRAIFDKVKNSCIFIGDVSIIKKIRSEKKVKSTPNPNVLIELGYALGVIGEEKVILVMNEHFGKVGTLPFDLSHRHVKTFTLTPNASKEDIEEAETVLKRKLKSEIKQILQNEPISSHNTKPFDAITNNKPNQESLVRAYMKESEKTIADSSPHYNPKNAGEWDKNFDEALSNSIPLVTDFAQLTKRIAEMDDATKVAKILYEGFGDILNNYTIENLSQPNSTIPKYDFDYAKFLGYELFVTFIAALIQEKKWEILKQVLEVKLYARIENLDNPIVVHSFTSMSSVVKTFQDRQYRMNNSYGDPLQSVLLKDRHSVGNLAEIVPIESLANADYFLYLRGIVENRDGGSDWLGWCIPYITRIPEYIHRAENIKEAKLLCSLLQIDSVEELRKVLVDAKDKVKRQWFPRALQNSLLDYDYNKIGTIK